KKKKKTPLTKKKKKRSKQILGDARDLFNRFDLKKIPVLEGDPPPAVPDLPFCNYIRPHTKVGRPPEWSLQCNILPI
ncbi:MAG: hypothetical protein PQJ58_05805, partial [Spirochaetales bacterium]|nr:hypothetical protein [Spirochaetales bacterium]